MIVLHQQFSYTKGKKAGLSIKLTKERDRMKLGIVISTNDSEEVWSAFRFANVALKKNHTVNVFLVNKGVEAEDIKSDRFPVKEQLEQFISNKGELLACGTCMKTRQKQESTFCPIATMNDLLEIVEESDKLVTFG